MHKTLKMLFSSALLVAALLSFSAFTSASPAGATAHIAPVTTMSPLADKCPLPVLQIGSKGSAVTLAQQSVMAWYNTSSTGFKTWLKNSNGGIFVHDLPIAVDGIYGSKTGEAVADFQLYYKHGLDDDGIVGPKTWAALGHCR